MFFGCLVVAAFFFAIYYLYIRKFDYGFSRPKPLIIKQKNTVSVIVAARNEEKNISFLLTTLTNQNYPSDLYEIIIADDQSTDNTVAIIEQFQKKWENIKIVSVLDRDQAKSPKKNALQQAINVAKGEIILTTDADCQVGQNWIEMMVAHFDKDISMVCGYSRTRIVDWKKATLVQKFEHFDFVVMFIAAAGAILSGKYFSCSGQNLAYRRDDFFRVGGFEKIKHLISGDDINLMQLFRKSGFKITFALNPSTFAFTNPIRNTKAFLNQRSRWASNTKWQIMLNREFFLYLFSVFMVQLSIVFFIFYHFWIGLIFIILKMIFDFQYINSKKKFFAIEDNRLRFFVIWFFLQPFYILLVGFMGQINLFKWHGKS